MSTLNVDKVDPSSGTALELGTSGDTITVPTGAGLTVTDEVKTNKVSPATGTAFALGDSGDTFTVPSGATIVNSGTATGFGITAASFLPNAQPLIINGDMGIWQRSTATVTMSDGYYNVDRFKGENNVASSAATWSRSTSVPDDTGFGYSLQVDCTTADASIGASEHLNIQQTMEAQDLQLLKWGTSDAEVLTVAFWVKSNQTGQHSCSFRKLDNTAYNQPKTYNVDVADTWEKKVLVFSALTDSGGEIDNNNGDGLQIFWKLCAGTSYQGTADVWTATNQAATAVSGDVNFVSSTSNNFYLTGVQIEVGTYTSATIPPFQHESYAVNLRRCQRYYLTSDEGTYINLYGVTGFAATTGVMTGAFFTAPAPMRTTATITVTGSTWRADDGQSGTAITGITTGIVAPLGNARISFGFTFSGTPLTTHRPYMYDAGSSSGRVELSAEL